MSIARVFRAVALLVVLLIAWPALGVSLIIDDPVEPNNGYVVSGFAGFDNSAFGAFIGDDRLEGTHTAWYNSSASFSKTFSGQTLAPGRYTVEFGLGNYNNLPWPGVADVQFTGMSLSQAALATTPEPASNQWEKWSATWNVFEDNAAIGQPLDFRLDIGVAIGNGTFDGVGDFSPDGNGLLVYYDPAVPIDPIDLPGLAVFGAPAFSGTDYVEITDVNNHGVAIGNYRRVDVDLNIDERYAYRWSAGEPVQSLGVSSSAIDLVTEVTDLNDAGVAVGLNGVVPVKWNPDASAIATPTALAQPVIPFQSARSVASINEAGEIAGTYGFGENGPEVRGTRAVRWASDGTLTILESVDTIPEPNLPTEETSANKNGAARFIAETGAVLGEGTEFGQSRNSGSLDDPPYNDNAGQRIVRWDPGETEPERFGTFDERTTSNGNRFASAQLRGFNAQGDAVGSYSIYTNSGAPQGSQAAFWPAEGSERALASLNAAAVSGQRSATAWDVNADGVVVGTSIRYEGFLPRGTRAVKWDTRNSTLPVELANLGTSDEGAWSGTGFGINDAGLIVGNVQRWEDGEALGFVATVWMPDGTLVDLNTLGIEPDADGGTWTLTGLNSINDNGWVQGSGQYDPDGDGPAESVNRGFTMQLGFGGSWVGGDGDWGDGPNWSTGTPAKSIGDAVFNPVGEINVTAAAGELTRTVLFAGGWTNLSTPDGPLVAPGGFTVETSATLGGSPILEGSLVNRGTLAPGSSPGFLIVLGSLTNEGTLAMEIGGTLPGDGDGTRSGFDQIVVAAGQLNLGGTLEVSLIDGFAPEAGDAFLLFNAAASAFNGDFDELVLPDLSGLGLAWDTQRLANSGWLDVTSVLASVTGDYDGSGSVEQADLDLVLTNWGGPRAFDDGVTAFATANVDQEELDLVLTNWGSSVSPSFGGLNIPEPGVALGLGLIGLMTRRCRVP